MTKTIRSPHIGAKQRVAQRPPSLHRRLSTKRGSLLLEAIIAIGVFSLFLGGIGLALILGERSTMAGGDRTRAAFIAEQQLEAVRQMRNVNYDSVTVGQHGVALGPAGWAWSGTWVRTNNYSANVTISQQGTDWLGVTSNVHWNFGNTRSGSVTLNTYVTNWGKIATVGNWATMTQIAQVHATGSPDYQKIVIAGNYAFVASTTTSGGKGLYVFNISNPAAPAAIATSLTLGASVYDLAVSNNHLYLATNDSAKEVQVFDITNPSALSLADRVNSYDLPGSNSARSITIYGGSVFVGTTTNGIDPQFFSIAMSETGPMVLNSTLHMSGSVLALGLQDGYGYAATGNNSGELQVADIFDPEAVTFAPGVGIDMTDVQDGISLALSGTSALIGRMNGSTISELTLYDIGYSPVPSPPPGPWTLEVGGNVHDLDIIFGSKYAFVGSSKSSTQILVIDLVRFSQGQIPIVKTFDTSATVNGLAYDWLTDRLFAVTPSSLFIFAPGS